MHGCVCNASHHVGIDVPAMNMLMYLRNKVNYTNAIEY